jgi:ribonuclease J
MGLQFPDEEMPGIDYIIPDITYLKDKTKNIRGVIITHGHYDHIGAIPHLMLPLGNPPLYTGLLTAGLIRKRQIEYKNLPELKITSIDEKTKLKLGRAFKVEFFRVNHNIPDSFGVVIQTPVGTVIHTGDFKIDPRPVNDQPMDLNIIKKYGEHGVLALMSDSTDAEDPGHQISETEAGLELEKIFKDAPGRIIIGTFASLLSRVQQIFTLAEKYNRKVLIQGRSMVNNIEIAHQLGYLKIKKGTIMEETEFFELPDKRIVIIATGAQGEKNAVLMRIANNEHRFIDLRKNDTVIFSSSVIPGNERTVQYLKDGLYRQGANVFHYKMMDIHAGGHAKQEELKTLIKLLKPKYFMPIEAHHYQLLMHGNWAEKCGIPHKNILIADNGQVMEFFKDSLGTSQGKLTNKKVPTNYVMVDGLGVGDVSSIVLRERRQMAGDGMFVVIATVDQRTGKLLGNPDIISRGFVYMKDNKELIEKTRMRIKKMFENTDPRIPANETYIKNKIRNNTGDFLFKLTKRRPLVLPVILEV